MLTDEGSHEGAGAAGGRPHKQEQEPAGEEVSEVAPGVLRAQLPIRMPGLGHVNCYLLVDDRGVALVDPGLPGRQTWRTLGGRLRQVGLRIGDVHTVVVTHSHIDHFGSAGRLARDAGAELVGHDAFAVPWLGIRRHHDEESAPAGVEPEWSDRTPWGGSPIRPPRSRRIAFWAMRRVDRRGLVAPVPARRVGAGDSVKLAGREWFAVHTPGHTLDHLCLHDPAEGVLLSGDHVLPSITPHIPGVGGGPDPLGAFVESLDHVAGFEPVSRVLPAHGHPFDDLPGRVTEIKAHHEDRLERLRGQALDVGGPASVQELARRLFRRARWGPMAESETYAHLEHLRLAGRADRHRGADGVLYYELG